MSAYPCPAAGCYELKCFRHCNSCGKEIAWRPPLLDREIAYKGPKPLNRDGSVHRCMGRGTSDGRFYYTGKKTYMDGIPEWVKKYHGDKKNITSVID
jgi:hypothetical protein